jgi:hypothetical protein
MTDQPPPTYPDPLRDALAGAGQTAVALGTAAAMASTIVVARRAARLHAAADRTRPARVRPDVAGGGRRRTARPVGIPPGAGGAGEEAAAGVRAARDRAAAADAVRAVLDGRLAAAVVAADEFDAMAGRLAAVARRFGLDHRATLRIAVEMIHRGVGDRDVHSTAAVLWARLGWLADPSSAPDWARRAAESAHAAAANRAGRARDVIDGEVVAPARGAGGTGAAERSTRAGGPGAAERSARASGAGEATAGGARAARDRAEATAAVRAVLDDPLAQRVLDDAGFDAMAGRLAAVARRLGLDHRATLRAAVRAVPEVLGAARPPAPTLRAWLGWLADPAKAPVSVRDRMRSARDGAQAADAVRALLDEPLAQRVLRRDAQGVSLVAGQLARTARQLGLDHRATLHIAVSAFPEVLGDTMQHSLSDLLRERLIWVADPAEAPDSARPVAESAHAAAAAQAARGAAAGQTRTSGMATGRDAAGVAGAAFPAGPEPAAPPSRPPAAASPAPPPARPSLGR